MPSSKTEDVSYRILFDREHEEEDIEGTASPATRVGSRIFWQIIPPTSTITHANIHRGQTIEHREFTNVDSLVTDSFPTTSHHGILDTPGTGKE